jgi:hypothetical protein
VSTNGQEIKLTAIWSLDKQNLSYTGFFTFTIFCQEEGETETKPWVSFWGEAERRELDDDVCRSTSEDASGFGQVLEQSLLEYGCVGDLLNVVLYLDLMQLIVLREGDFSFKIAVLGGKRVAVDGTD